MQDNDFGQSYLAITGCDGGRLGLCVGEMLWRVLAGLSLFATVVGCGTVRYSQRPGNLPVPVFSFHGELLRVAAASGGAAWAVGFSGTFPREGTLMLHWDGATWSRVTSPAVVNGAPGILTDVTAVSASDAWAVGFTSSTGRGLLLHWDGTRWSQVSGVLPANGGPSAITMSSHGGWAVGASSSAGYPQPLILRRGGAEWRRVPGPAPASAEGSVLTRVVVSSTDKAWASGLVQTRGSLPTHSDLMRWNGSSWQWTAFPIAGPANMLNDMAAGPEGTVWAVGSETTATSQPNVRRDIAALAMRWTGARWQEVHAPGGQAGFDGVTVAPGGTVWAVGSVEYAGILAMKWTGSTWARVPVPNAESPSEQNGSALTSVAFSSPTDGWAVGADVVSGTGKHSGDWPLIVHWDGTAWN